MVAFVDQLINAASICGHPMTTPTAAKWTATPVNTQKLQHSPTNCGMWVLAQIAAVLRGCHVTGITEVELGKKRISTVGWAKQGNIRIELKGDDNERTNEK